MNKVLVWAAFVLALLPRVAAASLPADPPRAPRAPLIVVADDNYPPYIFRRSDGTVDGYLVDEWKLWSRQTGVPVHLVAMDWAKARAEFAAGRADVIDTIFRTPEREKLMDFSQPYADLPVPIYVHRDIGGIADPDNLRGFLVGAKAGDACVDHLRGAGVSDLRLFPSYAAIVAAAAADQIRIFCIDAPPANYLLYRAGILDRYREAFVLYTGQFHRAVHKGDIATLALVQRGFDGISGQDKRALQRKWMGETEQRAPWGRILGIGLAAALVVAIVFLVWAVGLRTSVRRRTAELALQQQRLRTLLNTLPDLVWLKDLEGRYVLCNAAFERYLGASEAQIAGRVEADFIDDGRARASRASDQKALELDRAWIEETWLTFKGSDHQVRVQIIKTPMRDARGRAVGVLCIARDVTPQHEAQNRLERLNRLYRMLNAVADAISLRRGREALFESVCQIVVEHGGLAMAWVGVPDATAERIVPVAKAGRSDDYQLGNLHVSTADDELGRGPTGRAFREARTSISKDLAHETDTRPWHARAARSGFSSAAALPIRVDRAVCAVLTVYSERIGDFDAEEIALLERLSQQLGVALEAADSDAARSRAEVALRASEERFALMFRTSPVGLALGRLEDGTFLDVNDAWLDLLGYRREQVLGGTGLELNLWAEQGMRARVLDGLRSANHIGPVDTTVRRSDGRPLEVSVTATRLLIGGDRYLLASFVDISLRRRAEQSMAQQTVDLERYAAEKTAELTGIFQALPDLYFRMALDGTILDYRAGRRRELYVPPEQFVGRTMSQSLPADAAAEFEHALNSLRGGAEAATIEYTLPMPTGLETYEARLLPFGGSEAIAVVRNISERRALELAREQARAEAEELSRLRSGFLANMSHEIRTPLNAVMGLAQIGWANSATDSSPRDTFARILDACKLLLGIVNDVLDFSKIDADRLEVESVAMSPREVIADALDVARSQANAKGLTLTDEIHPEVPLRCLGDPLRLRQILLNLLTNAVKFTEQGGVDLVASRQGEHLLVQVRDTGIGIDARHLQDLFTPFQQADTSTTRRFGGTGLGLSISRRLAQLMGGDIAVQSELGHGSVFELRLPLQPLATGSSAGEGGLPPSSPSWGGQLRRLQGLRLLVAEDNPVNQIIIDTALQMEGAEVTLVDDGLKAVERIEHDGPRAYALVLMDLQMPLMDGFEATRRIRALSPDLPIVGQTAHAMLEEQSRCLAAGMVAHIAKPIDLEELVSIVRRHARAACSAGGTARPLRPG